MLIIFLIKLKECTGCYTYATLSSASIGSCNCNDGFYLILSTTSNNFRPGSQCSPCNPTCYTCTDSNINCKLLNFI